VGRVSGPREEILVAKVKAAVAMMKYNEAAGLLGVVSKKFESIGGGVQSRVCGLHVQFSCLIL